MTFESRPRLHSARHVRVLGIASLALGLVCAAVLHERPARACGGCFHPPTPREVTVVTGHRMAFSISPMQTVLWDQIKYSGNPTDFAWVLPVRAGAKVELSHDEFFAALEAATDPVITGPIPNCTQSSSGPTFGCGASSASGAFAASGTSNGGGDTVQVLSQGVVGPYATVTVHSTNPSALYDWLNANKYDVPASTRPVIDAYVAAGMDFLALRLAPGQGVQAMQPVRVVTPGAGLTLPLRMVSAGVGANVGITLYVLSEGRYQAQSAPNAVFDDRQLVWLHAQGLSNYEPLAEKLMAGGGGRTWLTEYAEPADLSETSSTVASSGGYSCGSVGAGSSGAGPSSGVGVSGGAAASIPALYFGQCLCLDPQAAQCDAGGSLLADAAPGDAMSEAGSSGGCTNPCAGFDDLDVAAAGLDPYATWLTRMRAIVPATALAETDLVLEAASPQTAVSNQHNALVYDDPTYNPCTANGAGGNGTTASSGGGGCSEVETPMLSGDGVVIGAFLGLAGISARRRRRRS